MAVYIVTGKLGSGKTLVTVGKIKDYLMKGRPVATNLDIYSEHIQKIKSKASFLRLPDKPRVSDLEAMGQGNPTPNEENNGLLVLDECGTWLNARTWNDPERKGFVDWMLHARKHGWDVMLIVQDVSIIDKQLKLSLCEHLVVCKRLDRLQIPFLSKITNFFFGLKIHFPKIHRARVFYGDSEQDLLADKWTYRARDLYAAYDTRQVFVTDEIIINDDVIDMRASYSVLPRWYLEGRYLPQPAYSFPAPKNVLQLSLYPAWVVIQLMIIFRGVPARRVGTQ